MPVRLFRNALLLLLALSLPSCATTRTTATTAEALCAPWRAISFSGRNDTAQTVRQVRVHNATGAKLKCWK